MSGIIAFVHCSGASFNSDVINRYIHTLVIPSLKYHKFIYMNSFIGLVMFHKGSMVPVNYDMVSEMKIEGNQIVYTGSITNFEILRDQLIGAGYSAKIQGESDLILRLYETIGPSFITYLDGIFSFIIWDHHLQKVFSACDALGINPLFYCETINGFLIGTNVDTFLALSKEHSYQSKTKEAYVPLLRGHTLTIHRGKAIIHAY